MKLVYLIHRDHNRKRKHLKKSFAEKLDKYISVFQYQISGYQAQVKTLEEQCEKQGMELEESKQQMRQGSNLVTKFKKKCYNAQKDLAAAERRMKFVEHENEGLRAKVEEMTEKLGDEFTEEDENDKRRLMLQIEEEIQEELKKQRDKNKEGNESSDNDDEEDLDKIADKDIIKEEDKCVDTCDFEYYWRLINGDQYLNQETQTERVTKKNVKIGVTSTKMGILRDKDTFVDPRMFEGEGPRVYRLQPAENTTSVGVGVDKEDLFNMEEDSYGKIDEEDIEEEDESL